MSNTRISHQDRFVMSERLQGGIHLLDTNSTGSEIVTKHLVGKVGTATQEPLALLNGFLKFQILQPMEKIVVNKGPHGPIIRNHLAGEIDQRAHFHALSFAIRAGRYRFHITSCEISKDR